jgi:anoctamin-7
LFFVFRQYALTIASISGAVINLIIIMILGRLYEIIAYKLTQWGLFSWGKKNEEVICLGFCIEMHRTQTDFDNHFTIKVFIFQFVNIYSSIFYIAFIKGK